MLLRVHGRALGLARGRLLHVVQRRPRGGGRDRRDALGRGVDAPDPARAALEGDLAADTVVRLLVVRDRRLHLPPDVVRDAVGVVGLLAGRLLDRRRRLLRSGFDETEGG